MSGMCLSSVNMVKFHPTSLCAWKNFDYETRFRNYETRFRNLVLVKTSRFPNQSTKYGNCSLIG